MEKGRVGSHETIDGLASDAAREFLGDRYAQFVEEVELVRGASPQFDLQRYRAAKQTPVFFGSAVNNFGVRELLSCVRRALAGAAAAPDAAARRSRPDEPKLTGFVFKIQANMDPGHRDRIAFMRLCSGRYARGMRLHHVRLDKDIRVADALTFLAADRSQAEEAYAGDIIGLHNHGTINIGDTFSEGEDLTFTGVPNFAPEIFRRAVLKDPLRMKALQKGLSQLCEEGATQLFKPLRNNDLILGAIGQLQFEVVAFRLQDEYSVQCVFEPINVAVARWVRLEDEKRLGGISRQGVRQSRPRSCRRAGVSRADAGQSRADRGALAGDQISEDARESRGLSLAQRCLITQTGSWAGRRAPRRRIDSR